MILNIFLVLQWTQSMWDTYRSYLYCVGLMQVLVYRQPPTTNTPTNTITTSIWQQYWEDRENIYVMFFSDTLLLPAIWFGWQQQTAVLLVRKSMKLRCKGSLLTLLAIPVTKK